MRKRRYGLVLVCFAVAVLILIGTVSAKTWYVDDDGGPGIDFTKIQQAVDAAHDGDTVFVYSGMYYENVVVEKLLTLQGEDRNTTIIDGEGESCVPIYLRDDCIYVDSDYVNISGFTLQNGNTGISIGSNYNEIFNNKVMSCGTGIGIWGSDYNNITNNTILLCNPNINLENSSYNNITNNIIYSSHCNGIILENSSKNGILNNIIYSNYEGSYYAICLESSSFNEIYHNDLINNTNPAHDDGTTSSWDNGPVIGGNYWSNHECTGDPSDGTQPYYIDDDSIDHYPFEHPINDVSSVPPPEPVAWLSVTKIERLLTNETRIEHDKDYVFEVGSWRLGVTDIHDLRTDNMTYTITTPANFTYLGNWEEYENGTWNHIMLNFTHVGQNYTWILPLKDRISSEVRLKLLDETIQHKPCIDMDVNTIEENNHTRINITFVPVTFGSWGWVNLYADGGHIINVTTYPPDFGLQEWADCVEISGEINKNQSYNFSILLDNPLNVRSHFYHVGEYEWTCDYSNSLILPVEGLGNVTLASDVPVGWAYEVPHPDYGQFITIEFEKSEEVKVFDTGTGTYPSIMGTHNGTIEPLHNITVNKMYTYPCAGTGGHSEYVWIHGNGINESATWNGYRGAGDYHYIEFSEQFTLEATVTYNYTIKTGSYPQIHHNTTLTVSDGEISCAEFIDANGNIYYDWIPAIRLE